MIGLKTVCHTKLAGDAMFAALTQPWDSKEVTFGTATAGFYTKEADRAWYGLSLDRFPMKEGQILFGVVHADGTMVLNTGRKDQLIMENDRLVFAKIID